jgi:NADPH:quinone reductase-like Zn-dependent oxidoreductase
MRAAFYNERGDIENLEIGDRPKPVPGDGEVLIKIRAAAVGAWDVHVMKGGFGNPPLPMIPGCEVAGVVEVGNKGSDFKPGEKVYGGLGFKSGGFAEYVSAAADHVARMPEGVRFEEAAALVVSAGTAYEGLIDRAQLQEGETVLVTAASGGVGSAAVQIAAAIGAQVRGVASARNHDYIRDLGVCESFDYNDPDWASRLKESLPEGVDVLFDGAGGRTRDVAVQALKNGGRGVFIVGAPPDLPPSTRAYEFSADVTRDRLENITALVDKGDLKAQIEAVRPLEEAREAMAHVGKGHTRGRVVLNVRSAHEAGEPPE